MSEYNDNHVVAIDLGTSKIALSVALVNGRDIQVIYYKEIASAGIKYSGVLNVVNSSRQLAELIKDAEESLGIKITQAVVGMPKYSIRQESNSGKIQDRGEDTEITAEDVNILKNFAADNYPLDDPKNEAIYGVIAQSFSDGVNFQIIEEEIIGMTGDELEGHFKIFIGKRKSLNNINNLMNRIEVAPMKQYFTAATTAKMVLSESEMENGVALIDFGGGCTSVTIYHGKIMRHYESIPFGGKNITQDIKSELRISEKLAENIKLAFGACMPDRLLNMSEKVLHIRGNGIEEDKKVTVKYISEIITSRIEEIIYAILYSIQESGFADRIGSGIVVTGGVAQTVNLNTLIKEISGYKVRTGYPKNKFSIQGIDGVHDTSAATSMGLILSALEDNIINCTLNGINKESLQKGNVAADKTETKEPESDEEIKTRGTAAIEKVETEENVDTKEEKDKEEEKKAPGFIKILWGKAQRFGENLKNRTDALIDNITEKNDSDDDEFDENDE